MTSKIANYGTDNASGTKLCWIDTVGPAQCWFTELAHPKAKIYNNFKDKLSATVLSNSSRKLLWFDLTYPSNAGFKKI